jgi:hypothetical protein
MNYEIDTIEACPDCYYAVEYGTDEMPDLTPERKAAIDKGIREWEKNSTSLHASGNDDAGFTRTPCDVCHMTLGHMAYEVILHSTPTV